MTKCITKTIPVDQAKTGMILAKDIITDTGFTLATKNTMLNKKSIVRLKLYQICMISIKEALPQETVKEQSSISTPMRNNSITKKSSFQSFQSSYSENIESLENYMLDISEGKNINITNLYSISHDLKNILDSKSDLFGFLHNLQTTDNYTYTHCVNVSLLCHVFGEWLGFDKKALKDLSVAGLLHDIGKTQIDNHILNKPDKLTEEEFEEIKKHPIYGFRLVEHQDIPYNIKMAILMHHERYDGSGYPLNAKNEQINDYAKIIAIADIYDAMTSQRSYRKKFCPFQVIRHFENTGYRKFDTKFLLTFLNHIASCYIGNWCLLSTGEEAKIVFINKDMVSKPIVQVDGTIVDLKEERNIFIEEII
ncbi:HD-GYP domain-containing protein [Crassaminicella profunda]|uniref:HD-GYP domain-containing protein n=1 Tax=Crassaminicella profunda TaxID=1286698 RepID=UPI001CA62EAC|nr:HD-GYP domain-containing protein [Crassaminicella profunda]QZY56235.1 HD-GYP domain-containing protein [Crassaminicella profunda]